MKIVKRHGKYGGREHIEDYDINVWVSFRESKHRHSLLGWRGFFFPSGEP
jgi:hypothetical protein